MLKLTTCVVVTAAASRSVPTSADPPMTGFGPTVNAAIGRMTVTVVVTRCEPNDALTATVWSAAGSSVGAVTVATDAPAVRELALETSASDAGTCTTSG